MSNTTHLKNHVWQFSANTQLQQIITIVCGSIFIALSAQITIPLLPVPVTLQTFAVLLISAALKPKLSSKIVIVYLLEGICGLPVFTKLSGGIAVFLGPTGGYLMGFVFAAHLVGLLLQNGWAHNRITIFSSILLGDIAIFTFGYLSLARLVGYQNAYTFGVAPFYLVELAKILVITMIITPFLHKSKMS